MNSNTRLSFLDSSRGIAALIVLLSHFQITILPQLNDSWIFKTPLKILIDGPAAVLYFFILSGFVLTKSLQKTDHITFLNYLKFITKRVFRIFPAFLFTLFISFVLLLIIDQRPDTWLNRFWVSKPDLFSLMKQAILVVRFPNDPLLRIIPQDWTLSIEIAISLLLPALAFASRTYSAFVLLFVYLSVQFLALDPFVFDFTLGVFMACNTEKLISRWRAGKMKPLLLVLALFLISADYVIPSMKMADVILIHHKIWGLAILLLIIISSTSLQRVLSIRPLVFLGKISYSFYLLHIIILFCMTVFFPSLDALPFLLLFLMVTIISSTITYNLIERPFNKLPNTIFRKE